MCCGLVVRVFVVVFCCAVMVGVVVCFCGSYFFSFFAERQHCVYIQNVLCCCVSCCVGCVAACLQLCAGLTSLCFWLCVVLCDKPDVTSVTVPKEKNLSVVVHKLHRKGFYLHYGLDYCEKQCLREKIIEK